MPELIASVAQLLWPVITLIVLLVFRRSIGRVIKTAEKRELEFEVGGQRLTFHELSDQQNELIQDLQRQLSALSRKLEEREQALRDRGALEARFTSELDAEFDKQFSTEFSTRFNTEFDAEFTAELDELDAPRADGAPQPQQGAFAADEPAELPEFPSQTSTAPWDSTDFAESTERTATAPNQPPVTVQAARDSEPFAVLWVAERPEHDALLIEQLRSNGVRVGMARSNSEASEEITKRGYRVVVTDMARKGEGPDAGLALLRELRDLGVDVPVIVYTSTGRQQYAAQARQLGAVAVTASAFEMVRNLERFALL